VTDWVGLRPGRTRVRLELEDVKGKSRKVMVMYFLN